MVRESRAAVVQNQDADVDPDAVIEVISPRTSPRSALRHPAERPRGPRTSRNSPETLRRTVARPPSVIVISDTDDDLTCPSTPPRGAGSTNDWLRLPTPPPTLRRSPRREPQASRADSNFPMDSNGPISAPQAVPSRATKGETSSASSAQPTPASSFMTRPASRSGPSVRSANLPGRLEYPVQVTGKQNGKAVDFTATDQPPVETIAPIKTAKEKSLGRSGITYARSSASRASSNTIVNPLTARATAGSRRLNILRATGHTAPAGTSTATVPVSLYPRLPSPLPILVTSTNVGTSRKAQINETRETTIRSVIPSRDEKAEKVGEKRRAVSGVDGEKRPGKRGRVEVRSDG